MIHFLKNLTRMRFLTSFLSILNLYHKIITKISSATQNCARNYSNCEIFEFLLHFKVFGELFHLKFIRTLPSKTSGVTVTHVLCTPRSHLLESGRLRVKLNHLSSRKNRMTKLLDGLRKDSGD